MKLLLDENLPKRLKQDLKEHEVYTAAERGWTGISNGKLAIIPGGHGAYIGEVTTLTPDFREDQLVVPMIEKFLNKAT